jgi:hypothetical protein
MAAMDTGAAGIVSAARYEFIRIPGEEPGNAGRSSFAIEQ